MQTNENSQNDMTAQETDLLLTDDQLCEQQGLVKVTAFVRTEQSLTALRKQKQREKEKATGLGQVNVKAPTDCHETIKQLAKLTNEGMPLIDALKAVTPIEIPKTNVTSHKIVTNRWRKWIIKTLMRLCRMLEPH